MPSSTFHDYLELALSLYRLYPLHNRFIHTSIVQSSLETDGFPIQAWAWNIYVSYAEHYFVLEM